MQQQFNGVEPLVPDTAVRPHKALHSEKAGEGFMFFSRVSISRRETQHVGLELHADLDVKIRRDVTGNSIYTLR